MALLEIQIAFLPAMPANVELDCLELDPADLVYAHRLKIDTQRWLSII